MQLEYTLQQLIDQKPEGAEIVAVKGNRISYFKRVDNDRLMTFNRTMWVKTWFMPFNITTQHFDLIMVV